MNKLVFAGIILILSLPIVFPLFSKGYFPMHDDTQIARVTQMTGAIRDGQFPVRSVKDLGYGFGYPLYNFYGPLPYYVGASFSLLGFSSLVATKIMMGIGMILPALTMGFVLYSFFGFLPGIIGSILYVYSPYHAVQLYVRGAVGELYALIFLPLIFYGILNKGKNFRTSLIGAVGLTGVIVSHTITGFVSIVFLAVFLLCLVVGWAVRSREIIRTLISNTIRIILLALGLSAFFWLPLSVEMGHTNVSSQVGGGADYRDHFVCMSQLWNSPWGFGGSTKGCIDGLSFRLGKIYAGILALGVALTFFLKDKKSHILPLLSIFLTFLSLFMMTEWSKPVWESMPFFPYIQYPWRFLVFVILGISLIGSWVFSLLKSSGFLRFAVSLGMIVLVLFISLKLFTPQYIYEFSASGELESNEIRTKYSSISDEYLPKGLARNENGKVISSGDLTGFKGIISSYAYSSVHKQWSVVSEEEGKIRLGTVYFPWWNFTIDKKPVLAVKENGMPVIYLTKGEHVIEARLSSTSVQVIGNIISLISVLLSIIYYGKKQIA